MRGGSIQHAHIGPQQRNDLAGGIVRQAEERQITLVDNSRAGVYVLAVGLGDMQGRKFRPLGQAVCNAQPGRAGAAIDLTTCCEGRTSYGGPTKASVLKQIELVKEKLK